MKIITTLMLLTICTITSATSKDSQSLDGLKQLAHDYLQQTIGEQSGKVVIKIGHLDKRLRLASCAKDGLEVYLPPRTDAIRTSTVGIRCRGIKPWSIYIPVRVKVLVPTIVAKHHLPRGTVIKARDLKKKEIDANRLRQGYFNDKKPLIGMIVRSSIYAGNTIKPKSLQAPSLIYRGETVSIIASSNGIRVTIQGVALNSGRIGETIRVKSLRNKRVLEGRVVGRKQVQVLL